MNDDKIVELLRHSVYLTFDPEKKQHFTNLSREIKDWDAFIKLAESNALSNLVYGHLQTCEIDIPDQHRLTFRALTARHTRNNRERTTALLEILEQFKKNHIESVILKGMCLIHTLYDKNSQRPMGDIDILVRADQALQAQQSLREIDYNAGDRKQGYLFDHHHLPVATKRLNGMQIQVEVHHNALSRDAADDMSYDQIEGNLIELDIEGRPTHSMGHVDMLQHLCHHTFEPIDKIKLGAIADIYGYAVRYHQDIDWSDVRLNHARVINTLRCLHFLSPLPDVLKESIEAPQTTPPDGVGLGFSPLSTTLIKSRSTADKFQRLFNCSSWWLHIFYVVPPEKSLVTTRYIRHPLNVLAWLTRRMFAKAKSALKKSI